MSAAKTHGLGIWLSAEEVIELKMIVQDADEAAALAFLQRLRKKVLDTERRHCGNPDKLPGLD